MSTASFAGVAGPTFGLPLGERVEGDVPRPASPKLFRFSLEEKISMAACLDGFGGFLSLTLCSLTSAVVTSFSDL